MSPNLPRSIDPWGGDTTTVDGARIGSYGLSFANPWLDINGYLAGYETRIEAVVAESRVFPIVLKIDWFENPVTGCRAADAFHHPMGRRCAE
jgi:hypothetical protein